MSKNFESLYSDVPTEQRDALRAFRENYAHHTLDVADTTWTYTTAGSGEKTILWLVGGLKRADAAYKSVPLMTDDYAIIAPDYPAVGSMDALADGLAAILDAQNIEQAYVLSGSFGGMLAQIFLRRHPKRVAKIILSTTTAPVASGVERYAQLRDMAKVAPPELLAETAQSQMFSTIAPPYSEADFYRAYLKELYEHRLTKADIVTIYEAIIDYMGRTFSDDDLAGWQGEMLIFNSDNDATFGDSNQQALYALYPDAQVHTFEGAGHSPGSTQREVFFQRTRAFFT
ncbi:MAG: alpha/beta hydrolase [Chloroflexota bacterium]